MCDATTCLHGACATNTSTGLQQCECDTLYTGAQCSVRSGNQLFELPLACVMVFGLLLVGLCIAERSLAMLRFHESAQDVFAFPRRFECTQWRLGALSKYVGTWVLDDDRTKPTAIAFRKGRQHALSNVFVALVIVLELVPWLQITALAFVPAVPWSATNVGTTRLLRLFVLHPLWTHVKPEQFSHQVFYFAVVAVPAGLMGSVLLGLKHFPLFKPQPKDSPAEHVCSIVLRLYSEWAATPMMIALALPLECLFVGYDVKGLPVKMAVPLASCFTLLQAGQIALGLAALAIYWLACCVITFQLNCESSAPVPTLWTDVRYASLVQILRAPLALAVVAFANSNASLLCLCSILVSATLGFVNAWMRPCAHSLINGVRTYGAVLSVWSAGVALVTTIMDDPTNKQTFEVWSVGAMGLSGASLAALLVFHTEDFWFRLSSGDSKGTAAAAAQYRFAGAKRELADDTTAAQDKPGSATPLSWLASMLRVRRAGDSGASEVATVAESDEKQQQRAVDTTRSSCAKLSILRRARLSQRIAASAKTSLC